MKFSWTKTIDADGSLFYRYSIVFSFGDTVKYNTYIDKKFGRAYAAKCLREDRKILWDYAKQVFAARASRAA